jgi:hypothetical protein
MKAWEEIAVEGQRHSQAVLSLPLTMTWFSRWVREPLFGAHSVGVEAQTASLSLGHLWPNNSGFLRKGYDKIENVCSAQHVWYVRSSFGHYNFSAYLSNGFRVNCVRLSGLGCQLFLRPHFFTAHWTLRYKSPSQAQRCWSLFMKMDSCSCPLLLRLDFLVKSLV